MTLVRILALGVLVAFLAACGATQTPSVASLGTTTTAGSGTPGSGGSPRGGGSFVKFVSCMRAHGVQVQVGDDGQGVHITGNSVDPRSTQFQQAQTTCQKLLPGGGPKPLTPAQQEQQLKQLVKLAKCMRSHGVANFPDPTPTSPGFDLKGPSSAVDPSSPQFQAAAKACGASNGKGGFAIRVRT